MAPEFFVGGDKISCVYDRSVDWWAVGILMYELLIGKTPFVHENRNKLMKNITKSEIHWPNDIPASRHFKDLV